MNNPLVSICCITYNQASYIRECLEGFVMQKTNFDFEIIIHDDASTDGTIDVIKEYKEKYPHLFYPFFEDENQYSKGVRGMFSTFVFPKARGKYVALCEGDDYWTDPLKLQKQVDFMESHPDYSMCFHNAIIHYEDKTNSDGLLFHIENRDYSYSPMTVPTASVMLKKCIFDSDFYLKNLKCPGIIYGDNFLFYTCIHEGKVKGSDEVMSVYRKHKGGVFYDTFVNEKKLKKHILHWRTMKKIFGAPLDPIANPEIKYTFWILRNRYKEQKKYVLYLKTILHSIILNPSCFIIYIKNIIHNLCH